jgi:hypothetical protein
MIRTGAPPSALPKAKTADDLTITAEKKNTHTKSGNKGGIRRYPKEQNHFYLRSHKRPRGGTTHPTNRRSRRGAIRQGSPTFEDSTSTGVDHARIGKWVPPSVPAHPMVKPNAAHYRHSAVKSNYTPAKSAVPSSSD